MGIGREYGGLSSELSGVSWNSPMSHRIWSSCKTRDKVTGIGVLGFRV